MLIGQQFGPFTIDKELGSGAMGTVYRATYTKTGQRVALKVMSPGVGGSPTAQARFEREGEILKQLNHPNIVKLFGVGKSQRMRYYAMEYIQGEALDQVLQRKGRLTWEEVVALGTQLCTALQHAHEHGIIHRDLKPSNIMILPDGTLKLTDFGIAKDLDVTGLTATNATVGTASYMSPEQCRGERELTHKSDLYSMGIVFYELLTGKKPLQAESVMDMFMQHINGKFERPSRVVYEIPVWLDTLVCQLLEKKPGQRPRDANAVADALGRITEKVTAQQSAGVDLVKGRAIDRPRGKLKDEADREAARTLHEAVTKRKLKRKTTPLYQRGWFVAAGVLVLLAGLGGLIWWVLQPPGADALYEQAERLMASSDTADWDKAIGTDGPITVYMKHYRKRTDEQAAKMHAWEDQAWLSLRERQLTNRIKSPFDAEDETERAARVGLSAEKAGDLGAAEKAWQRLIEHKDLADPDRRAWGLLADKHLRDLQGAKEREQQARQRVAQARATGRLVFPEDEVECLVFIAAYYEDFGDVAQALKRWQAIKDKCTGDPDRRLWAMLAHGKLYELKGEDKKKDRTELVKDALARAKTLQPAEAQKIYRDIVWLYKTDPDLTEQVEKAEAALKPPEAPRP